ncbi:MAG: Eco29kI family restriction endonuclease [Microcoleaceae cyanobacterium]
MSNFNRSQHVYTSPDFDKIVREVISFLNSTPVYQLPISEQFYGTGVYVIYCMAISGIYSKFSTLNRGLLRFPIYVGKAVPKGWRQARQATFGPVRGRELSNRLREHVRSIQLGEGLDLSDYFCRFVILEGKESDLIGTVEATLIRQYQPLWNTLIDGFGNHDPGKGRYEQAKSNWDVCHPGRAWAEKCQGIPTDKNALYKNIAEFLDNLDATEEI